MAIGRSPNYPRITLEEALEKIKVVYEKQHTYATDKEVLSKNLGYGGINGGSQSMVAALIGYGLLTKVDNNLKVSDEAVSSIELPIDSFPRIETIRALATYPFIFANLEETYPDKLPQNELIRHFLIKKGFLPKAAEEVIRIYRANLEFVNELDSKYNKAVGNLEETEFTVDEVMQSQKIRTSENIPPIPRQRESIHSAPETDFGTGKNVVSFNLSRTGTAQVRFNGQITQEAIKKLVAHLNLSLDTYPTQAELEQPKSAMWRNKDHDVPVNVTGEVGELNGKRFMSVEGSNSGIPEDELDFGDNN